MGFIMALQFLTIIPLPLINSRKQEHIGRSLTYFPLIGLILGLILSGINYALLFVLPASIVSVLLIIALAILTGAHHLDGFVDTFDGLVGGKSKERRLEIMADSSVGAFGIVAVMLLLLLKYVSLNNLACSLPELILMTTLSRWIMVSSIFIFPGAKKNGSGATFKQEANWIRFTLASFMTAIISFLFLNWIGIAVMAVLWLICWGIAGYLSTRFGGLTGDCYGALNELAEVICLILLIIAWGVFI